MNRIRRIRGIAAALAVLADRAQASLPRIPARCVVSKRCSMTAKSVAIAQRRGEGRDDVAEGALDGRGDARVGLGGQPEVVVGVGDRGAGTGPGSCSGSGRYW